FPAIKDGPQYLLQMDHHPPESPRLSWRYTYDSRHTRPQAAPFPGFVQENSFNHHNFLFADSYTFSPSYTNEFRFSYGRPDVNLFATWPGSSPFARTLPQIQITNVSAPSLVSANAQFHHGENFLFHD